MLFNMVRQRHLDLLKQSDLSREKTTLYSVHLRQESTNRPLSVSCIKELLSSYWYCQFVSYSQERDTRKFFPNFTNFNNTINKDDIVVN